MREDARRRHAERDRHTHHRMTILIRHLSRRSDRKYRARRRGLRVPGIVGDVETRWARRGRREHERLAQCRRAERVGCRDWTERPGDTHASAQVGRRSGGGHRTTARLHGEGDLGPARRRVPVGIRHLNQRRDHSADARGLRVARLLEEQRGCARRPGCGEDDRAARQPNRGRLKSVRARERGQGPVAARRPS